MGQASPITRYKIKLMSTMINSPDLINLVNDKYTEDNLCNENTDELIYKQLFPFYYIPDVQTDKLSYIMMKIDIFGTKKKLYNRVDVYICVMSHQDCMQVQNEPGTRIDLMAECVERLFSGRDDFGFGEMALVGNQESSITDKHRCRILRFSVEDFNANACKDS